ncbi:hypothetical protein [Winogradskyella pulchriflava]|uniref:Uncharacterized protein n=1 Tax=Winogradskyella pulchriflava TaxID=1110688 RepID=A0ABV6QCC1_9FLAO
MKRLLIILTLMMTSLTLTSQNTKTDSVTISKKALKSMVKESRKCDSLRVAYNAQYTTLQDLIKSNLDYFKKIQTEELKRANLQQQLDDSVKALRKKKNNWLLPTSIGVVGGLVLGVVISN